MTIAEIYEKYKIPPNLQEHQLGVAAVAKQICDNLNIKADSRVVVEACLLHDMGNILKYDFDNNLLIELSPEELEYWKSVKQEFADKYGEDEHSASLAIAKELNVSDEILDCIESVDFGKTIETMKRPAVEPKICDYADLRVAPNGVVSLDQRLEDGNRRYKDNPEKWLPDDVREKILEALHRNEEMIFRHSKIKPTDITDESIAPIIEQLRTYEIKT